MILTAEKVCSICEISKPYELFPKYAKTGKPRKWCRECMKTYKRDYPKTNPSYQARNQAEHKSRKKENVRKVYAYLSSHHCVDCGNRDILVLQFDHVRGEKTRGISTMLSDGTPWTVIQKEILKCDVRCGNCHRKVSVAILRYSTTKSKSTIGQRAKRLYIKQYLVNKPCVDCGESDPIVLEFDHVRGKKEFAISHGVDQKLSESRLLAEILKCEIRCVNCHLKKTARTRKHNRYLISLEF